MSSAASPNQSILLRILAPAALIGIGFVWFCYLPSQRALLNRRVELEKRTGGNSNPSSTIDTLKSKLVSIQADIAAVDSESQRITDEIETIATQQKLWERDSTSRGSEAKAIASTLEVMRLHNLVCRESNILSPVSHKEERTQGPSSKTSSTNVAPSNRTARVTYRIRFDGRFEDVRVALIELRKSQTGVVLQSIEMDETDPLSEQRSWTLILDIEPRI